MKRVEMENRIAQIIEDLKGMRSKVIAIGILSEMERLGMKPPLTNKEINGDKVSTHEWDDKELS